MTEPAQAPPKPSRPWKRRILLASCILGMFLLTVFLPALIASFGKGWILEKVEQATGFTAQLEGLSLGWTDAELTGLVLQGEGAVRQVEISRALAKFSVWDYLFSKTAVELDVTEPFLYLHQVKTPDKAEDPGGGEGREEEKKEAKKGFAFADLPLNRLRIGMYKGKVHYRQDTDLAVLEGVTLNVTARKETEQTPLWGGVSLKLGRVDVPAGITGGEPYQDSQVLLTASKIVIRDWPRCFTVDTLSLGSKSASLSLAGIVECVEEKLKGRVDFQARSEALLPWLADRMPPDLQVEGGMAGTLLLQGEGKGGEWKDWEIGAEIGLPDLAYQDTRVSGGEARVNLKGGILQLQSLHLPYGEGSLKLAGKAEPFQVKPKVFLEAEIKKIPAQKSFLPLLAYVLPVLSSKDPNLVHFDGAVEGRVKLETRGWKKREFLRNLKGQGKIQVAQARLRGPSLLGQVLPGRDQGIDLTLAEAPFELGGRMVTTKGILLQAKDFQLNMVGRTSFDGALDYSMKLKLPEREGDPSWQKKLTGLLKTRGLPAALTGNVRDPKLTFRPPSVEELGKDLGKEAIDQALDFLKKKKKKD